jgi:phosphoglycerate dehydrogenase-like enzyme
MRKALFLVQGERRGWIKRVYPADTVDRIRQYTDLPVEILDREDLEIRREELRGTEFVFSTWGMPALSETEIARCLPQLKAVFYAAGTVQGFARPFLNRGITVVSAWAANAVPVAEYTLAQILLANKGFAQNARKAQTGYAAARAFSENFPGNFFTKVGILGAGMIGTKVIELLKPFHLEVMVYDPFLPAERAVSLGVAKASLAEVFAQCQTISNHIANLPATIGLLDRASFNLMLPSATFINTGRGAQVVEADLALALKSVPTRTAILDVTDPEPLDPGNELLRLENVVLTTHLAGSMGREVERMGAYMAEEFIRFIEGKTLRYAVTMEMLETMA